MPVVRDALGHHSFRLEPRRVWVAAGGKRLIQRSQETFFGKASLWLGQHHVGRDEPFVVGAFEQREHGADARVGQTFTGGVPGLHQVGGGFMTVVAVGHAPDERILVGLLGQVGKQFAKLNPVHIGGDRLFQLTHVVVARVRLGVPGVNVRHATPQEDLDDRLGLGFGRGGFDTLSFQLRTPRSALRAQQQSSRAEQTEAQSFAPGHRQTQGQTQ